MPSVEEFRAKVERREPHESALMLTELVGYTRLVDAEPERALKLLEEYSALLKASIAHHQGIIARVLGDAHLVEFPDPATAVRCALDVQFRVSLRNARSPDFQRLAVRIGVHTGAVIPRGGELTGDCLKLLSFLGPKAPATGGVCISQAVRDAIAGKRGFEIHDQGEQMFPGSAKMEHVYRATLVGSPAPTPIREERIAGSLLKSVPTLTPLPLDIPPSDYAPSLIVSKVETRNFPFAPVISIGVGLIVGAVIIYFGVIRKVAADTTVPPASTAERRTPATSGGAAPKIATAAPTHSDIHLQLVKSHTPLDRLRSALSRIEKLPKAQQKKILPDIKDWKKVERDMSEGKKGADVDKKVLARLEQKLDEVERKNAKK